MTHERYKDREYLSGYDLNIEVFKYFGVKVKDVVPMRKVFFATTDKGEVVLKKIGDNSGELGFTNEIIMHVKENGFERVFEVIKTTDDELYKEHNGESYCMMKKVEGRECQFSNPVDLKCAARAVGEFHKAGIGFEPSDINKNNIGTLIEEFEKRIDELIFFKKLVGSYKIKNNIDEVFIKNVDYYIKEGQKSIELLKESKYKQLCEDASYSTICHNDLAHHNILIDENEEAYFVDFDYSMLDLKVYDLCNFINKVAKSSTYDIYDARLILKGYMEKNKLDKYELEVLYAMLRFPQDFYNVSKLYYSREKDWEEDIFLSKMKKKAGYKEDREEFLSEFEKMIKG